MVEDLMKTHRSQSYNPLIANAFFRSGQIESWGRGIEKIAETCKAWGKPSPIIEFKRGCEFSVTFYSDANISTNFTTNITINEAQKRILTIMAVNPRVTVKVLSA